MILKLRALAFGDTHATSTGGYNDIWINMDTAQASTRPSTATMAHVSVGSYLIPGDEWEQAVHAYNSAKYPQLCDISDKVYASLSPDPGYQFTSIIEDDGRTLESYPLGLAGLEVRVMVLGDPVRRS